MNGLERGNLEADIWSVFHGDLADQTLEGQAWDEQVGGVLVAANLSQGNRAWAVAAGALVFLER